MHFFFKNDILRGDPCCDRPDRGLKSRPISAGLLFDYALSMIGYFGARSCMTILPTEARIVYNLDLSQVDRRN
jgi:hypothetical protein